MAPAGQYFASSVAFAASFVDSFGDSSGNSSAQVASSRQGSSVASGGFTRPSLPSFIATAAG